MAYKILYVEDLDPGSIIHELQSKGFAVEKCNPKSLEDLIEIVPKYDLLLLDFRLTENKDFLFDAPTIAQTIRTIGGTTHFDIPIVLISTEEKITDYYRDYTSRDLFDYSVSKETFLKNITKYATRFQSVIEAYKTVKENKKNLDKCLNISLEKLHSLDYRISEQLLGEVFNSDIFAFNSYVLNQIIRSIGILIGEDVLSARLGVSKASKDWEQLKEMLTPYRYSGIYASAYERWWNEDIEIWWKAKNNGMSLRRLSAEQRVEKLIALTDLKSLSIQQMTGYATSSSYWTICKHCKLGIDSIDGLELHQRDLKPWQEKEYISIQAALEGSELEKYIKPYDRKRLREIAKKINNESLG